MTAYLKKGVSTPLFWSTIAVVAMLMYIGVYVIPHARDNARIVPNYESVHAR